MGEVREGGGSLLIHIRSYRRGDVNYSLSIIHSARWLTLLTSSKLLPPALKTHERVRYNFPFFKDITKWKPERYFLPNFQIRKIFNIGTCWVKKIDEVLPSSTINPTTRMKYNQVFHILHLISSSETRRDPYFYGTHPHNPLERVFVIRTCFEGLQLWGKKQKAEKRL